MEDLLIIWNYEADYHLYMYQLIWLTLSINEKEELEEKLMLDKGSLVEINENIIISMN